MSCVMSKPDMDEPPASKLTHRFKYNWHMARVHCNVDGDDFMQGGSWIPMTNPAGSISSCTTIIYSLHNSPDSPNLVM